MSHGASYARFPELSYRGTVDEAVSGAELVLLLTEWQAYVDLDPADLKTRVAEPRVDAAPPRRRTFRRRRQPSRCRR